jgi:predicted transcriptional regulator
VLRILVQKRFLKTVKQGKKYLYLPIISHKKATNSAIKQLLTTYFDNSLEKAVTAMLEMHSKDVSTEELNRLARLIDRVTKEDVR